MSLKKFIQKVWDAISNLWHKLDNEAKILVPVAIQIVNNIQKFEDTHIPDVLVALIPNGLGTALNQKIKEAIPKVLLELNMIDAVASNPDPNEQLKAIIAKIKLSGNNAQDIFWHGLASKFLELISDGKFTWNDAVALADYYYNNKYTG